ncbi:hypothetical protein FGM00_10465 [Aggregatimonas sangjinii]|uniref:Uncharacterized protein n=1 Tax=Aggregatimonas sangjinii TaxID=2583587 RepID=A0A5B7SPK1_9FLAO|nr:hypothetical protein [Aggregatimonas sangjinii]QCX00516.1 hypothetical protein FGM00_10465 [Aggregatimonas sangjinii]
MDKSTLHIKNHLVRQIEDKLGWGIGATWGNKDFEELSEQILKKTSKRISVTTLKRIWGRTEWLANPSMATLDMLSEFIGYENWRAFVRTNEHELPKPENVKKAKPLTVWIPVIALVLLGSFFGFFWKTDANLKKDVDGSKTYEPEDFVFSSRPVSMGIPNSVIFDYDVSAASDGARVEIQQDWDDTKRTAIDKKDSIATSIYYRPGFFKAKLVLDSVIVKEQDVFITTQDWLGIIQKNPYPIYLNSEDIHKEDRMAITPDILADHKLDPRTDRVIVSFYQVKDFGELYTGNFEMSVLLKNDFKEGVSGACQAAQVFILYDGGAIGIPLAKKGCVADLELLTFEEFVDGKKNDLSDFGVDFNAYVRLKCVSKNRKLEILINDRVVYQMNVPDTELKIKGISIHFEGAGSIKNVAFKKDKEIVYQSDF